MWVEFDFYSFAVEILANFADEPILHFIKNGATFSCCMSFKRTESFEQGFSDLRGATIGATTFFDERPSLTKPFKNTLDR